MTHDLVPTSNAELDIASLFRAAQVEVVAAVDSSARTPHLHIVFPRALPIRRVAAAGHIATATAHMMSPSSVRWRISLATDLGEPNELRLFVQPSNDIEAELVGKFLRFLVQALTDSDPVAEG